MPEYKILRVTCFNSTDRIHGKSVLKLEQQVNEYVARGWIPIGGVVVEVGEGNTEALLQTMWLNTKQ